MAALRLRLTRPWRSISMTTTMISSPTWTTSSTVGHVVVGQLADADEALLAGQDLDEGAEAHDAGDLAQVQRADLDLAGERLDPLDRLATSSPELTAAISTLPSSSTLISVPVSSWILRIMAPPLPMMSRIFSGLILMVMMRGAKSLTSPRAVGQDLGHLARG